MARRLCIPTATLVAITGLSLPIQSQAQSGQLPAVAVTEQRTIGQPQSQGVENSQAEPNNSYGRTSRTQAETGQQASEAATGQERPNQASAMPERPRSRPSHSLETPVTVSEPVKNLIVTPGVNEIVKVATSHLNRIETPFSDPEVMTVSDSASTQIKQNVVYVAPTGRDAVTMFINEKGDESTSISLTLVPRRIPPRAFRISFTGGQTYNDQSKAEAWETSSPYQDTITHLLRDIAQGQIPSGYSMSNSREIDPPFCRQQGLSFDFVQKIMGRNFWVAVGTMTNRSGHRIEFNEDSCMYEQRVAAVAAWPAIILNPGDTVELYTVIRHIADTEEARPERPSLIQNRPRQAASIGGKAGFQPADSGPFKIILPPFESERIARQTVASLRSNGFPAETYEQAGKNFIRIPGYHSTADAQSSTQMLQRLGYDNLTVAGEEYR